MSHADALNAAEEAIRDVLNDSNAMVNTGNGADDSTETVTDVGPENIMRASELSSGAMREAYEECATRVLQLAKANVDRAVEDMKRAEQFAHAVRSHGRQVAEQLEAGFVRASTMAAALNNSHSLIDKN
jgi:hypothetical protein